MPPSASTRTTFNNFGLPTSVTLPSNVPDDAPDEIEGPAEEALRGHTVENPLYEQFPVGTCDQGDAKTYCEHVHLALTTLSQPTTATAGSPGWRG